MNIHSIFDFLNIPNLELGIVMVLTISITLLFVCRWIDYLLPFWMLRKNDKKRDKKPRVDIYYSGIGNYASCPAYDAVDGKLRLSELL
jgi:hypothetical protein